MWLAFGLARNDMIEDFFGAKTVGVPLFEIGHRGLGGIEEVVLALEFLELAIEPPRFRFFWIM